jgi:hypothetical protein
MINDLYDFRENLIREGIFFCFNGPVSQNILAEIGSALEQRMKLAPRMIQSMEILQLNMMALNERIEQELVENVTLERVEKDKDAPVR